MMSPSARAWALYRAHEWYGYELNLARWFNVCPCCGACFVTADRTFHADGSDNRNCWRWINQHDDVDLHATAEREP